MTVLELAERLGNVTEACRRGGIDRTSFYDWKRRFQLQGLDGLKDLPPIAKSHPMTTAPEVVARIEELALTHPAYGCNRIEALLALEGRRVSAITVQKILNDKGLGHPARALAGAGAAERRAGDRAEPGAGGLPGEAEPLLPRAARRERAAGPAAVGRHLHGRRLKGIGRVYLHAVVDTHGSYAFGFLHVSKQPEAAVAVLHNDVLPFYDKLGLPVRAVLTDNGREFCGTERHPYELYLALNDIEHRKTRVRTPAPTASSSASTAPCWRSSSGRPCTRSCSTASRPCRPTSMPGCTTTTTSGPTWATATRADGRGKPSSDSSDKKVKRTS